MATLTLAEMQGANSLAQQLITVNQALLAINDTGLTLDGVGISSNNYGSIRISIGAAMPAGLKTQLTSFLTTQQTNLQAALTALGAPTA